MMMTNELYQTMNEVRELMMSVAGPGPAQLRSEPDVPELLALWRPAAAPSTLDPEEIKKPRAGVPGGDRGAAEGSGRFSQESRDEGQRMALAAFGKNHRVRAAAGARGPLLDAMEEQAKTGHPDLDLDRFQLRRLPADRRQRRPGHYRGHAHAGPGRDGDTGNRACKRIPSSGCRRPTGTSAKSTSTARPRRTPSATRSWPITRRASTGMSPATCSTWSTCA